VVTNTLGIKESVKGKWWRPEDLGIVDYSQQSLNNSSSVIDALLSTAQTPASGQHKDGGRLQSTGGAASLYNDQDVLVLTDDIVPLVPGLLDGLNKNDPSFFALSRRNTEVPTEENGASDVAGIDDFEDGIGAMSLAGNGNNGTNSNALR